MNYLKVFVAFAILLTPKIYSEVIPYGEDAYCMQAPQEIVSQVQKGAGLVEYDGNFEVIVPKKPGIQVNPWNKFIAYGINPTTQTPFILVNPSWFAGIEQEQQLFLLGRCFAALQTGKSLGMKLIPFLFALVGFLLIFAIYWLLGKTALVNQKKWVRIVIAWCIVFASNTFILHNVQSRLMYYMNSRYDVTIIKTVIEKTGDKDAAIKALRYFDASIKASLQDGETFFAPYADLFENYVRELVV